MKNLLSASLLLCSSIAFLSCSSGDGPYSYLYNGSGNGYAGQNGSRSGWGGYSNCSAISDATDCQAASCTWNATTSVCSWIASPPAPLFSCASATQAACTPANGCEWIPAQQIALCQPAPTNGAPSSTCANYNNSASGCAATTGCVYNMSVSVNASCAEWSAGCSGLPQASCTSGNGCQWLPAQYIELCQPAATNGAPSSTCANFNNNETGCNGQTGCVYNTSVAVAASCAAAPPVACSANTTQTTCAANLEADGVTPCTWTAGAAASCSGTAVNAACTVPVGTIVTTTNCASPDCTISGTAGVSSATCAPTACANLSAASGTCDNACTLVPAGAGACS